MYSDVWVTALRWVSKVKGGTHQSQSDEIIHQTFLELYDWLVEKSIARGLAQTPSPIS